MTYKEVLSEVEEKMDKALQVFSGEVRGIRTGRATPALIENIRVEYYGSPTPLNQIATISAPEARLLVVKPFEASIAKNIEKAILKSDLGLSPNLDGKVLRLSVPALSEERRHQLAKQVKDLGEKAKIAIRNIRREGNKRAEELEKNSTLSEDESHTLKDDIQKQTGEFEKKIDKMYEDKKTEILEE